MGRHSTFDREQVLEKVMHLFREQGYKATSLKDLERVTGLNPSSLYNSFGSKKNLFLSVVEHYNKAIVEQRIEAYLPHNAGLEGIRNFFQSVLTQPKGKVKGCLLTNSATEFAGNDLEVTELVGAGFGLLQVAFQRIMLEEREAGRLALAGNSGDDELLRAGRSAMQILGFYQGVLVLARHDPTASALPLMIDDFFDNFNM